MKKELSKKEEEKAYPQFLAQGTANSPQECWSIKLLDSKNRTKGLGSTNPTGHNIWKHFLVIIFINVKKICEKKLIIKNNLQKTSTIPYWSINL